MLWESRTIALREGDNIVGRDAGAAVRVDSSTVSRQHARIRVSGATATVEDLGSKNGTFVGERRIESPTPLEDGDEIRVGSARMTFRVSSASGSTATAQ